MAVLNVQVGEIAEKNFVKNLQNRKKSVHLQPLMQN